MNLDGGKTVCGICRNWNGKREWIDGNARVKSSARGRCTLLGKVKPPHGGCDRWQRWDGTNETASQAATR